MAEKAANVQEQGFDAAKLYVWVKGLESKVNNLTREVNLLKNDVLKKQGDFRRDVKVMGDDLLEGKRQQEQLLAKMDVIVKELRQTAGVEEMMTLRKYVELWNPLNFVTQRDVERIIQTKIGEVNKKAAAKENALPARPEDIAPAGISPQSPSPAFSRNIKNK